MKLITITCVLAYLIPNFGCGTGSVGADPCPNNQQDCAAHALKADSERPIPAQVGTAFIGGSPELQPTWIRALDVRTPQPAIANYPYLQLLTDRDRALYLAWVSAAGALRVSRLDDDGNVGQSSAIIALPASVDSREPPVLIKHHFKTGQVDSEPAFEVAWNLACELPSQCSPGFERIIFSSDLDAAPARFELFPIDDVLRDSRGDIYTLTSTNEVHPSPVVQKLDGETKRVKWTQDDLLYGEEWRFVGGVVLSQGRTGLLLSNGSIDTHITVELDEAGVRTQIGLDEYTPGTDAIALLAAGGKPVLVMGTNAALDVMHLRPIDQPVEYVRFFGDSYVSTVLLGLAADPDGNVYFATRTGGIEGIKPALCRAKNESGSCVVLPPYVDPATKEELVVDEIVARNGGVIYLRSGEHLLRLDFPG